jgi:hypothetical protein
MPPGRAGPVGTSAPTRPQLRERLGGPAVRTAGVQFGEMHGFGQGLREDIAWALRDDLAPMKL